MTAKYALMSEKAATRALPGRQEAVGVAAKQGVHDDCPVSGWYVAVVLASHGMHSLMLLRGA